MISRLRRFFSFYRPYKLLFITDMLCAFILTACLLGLTLCTRSIVSALQQSQPSTWESTYWFGGIMLLLVIIHALCRWFVDYHGHMMGAYIERDIRKSLFEHYQKLSFSFYDEHKTGELMTHITNDSWNLAELFHHGPEDFVICMVSFFGALGIMMSLNFKLSMIVLTFMIFMGFYTWFFNKKMNHALKKCRQVVGDINAQVEDSLGGIRVVRSFANHDLELEKFSKINKRFLESRRIGYKSEGLFYSGMQFFIHLMTLIMVVIAAIETINSRCNLPDIITFLLLVTTIVTPIEKFCNLVHLYQEAITGLDRYFQAMAIKPSIVDRPNTVPLKIVQGSIEFRNVFFSYTKELKPVLADLNFTIKAGEFVALVGESGVGKTTLSSLIPRFYDVSSGAILIDGLDIRNIPQQDLWQNIGLVQQDIYIFNGTIYENIAYGKIGSSREEVIMAAKQANAHDFIMQLPMGYDTKMGQRGVKLSGGQKQRISIARIFLKNPSIVIFDEATSALDTHSEQEVQKSLELLFKNRTTIVIAHRLSTVKNAQRIIVLGPSGIVEQGNHHELLRRNNVYAQLFNKI